MNPTRGREASSIGSTSTPYGRWSTRSPTVTACAGRNPAARVDQIGVTGFCRGGLNTLLSAAHNREVKAAIAWYGRIRPVRTPGVCTVGPLDVAAKIDVPVPGLYGGE